MELFAPRHLLVILLIVIVVFGTKKLRTLGSDLGSAVRGFKQAMKEGEAEEPAGRPADAKPALPDSSTRQPETASSGQAEGGQTTANSSR